MSCPRSWEVRAIDEGRLAPSDEAAFERHVRTCSICLAERAALQELRDLTGQLTTPGPNELELRRVRARVLRDAMSAPSPSPRRARVSPIAAAVAALAAAALVLSLVSSRTRPAATVKEPFAAVVTPAAVALWTQTREHSIEHVALDDGDLSLQVRKQAGRERFIVTLPDGEVEVRGTIFEVSVHEGRTARVHVDEGVVVVRVHGERILSAGETWSPPLVLEAESEPSVPVPVAPAPRASVAVSPAVPASPPSVPSTARSARRAPSVRGGASEVDEPDGSSDPEMSEYQGAIDAYRLARFDQAVVLLHAFLSAHPSSPLLDDASFIEASSSASAGHADAAGRLAERHLLRFPASFHHKDACILVARARRDRDDCAGARSVLAPWLAGPPADPAVGSALGHCSKDP